MVIIGHDDLLEVALRDGLSVKLRRMRTARRLRGLDLFTAAAALGGPLALTAFLLALGGDRQRYYVFLYLGLVAIIATLRGLWPALVGAAASFLCLDYFFVPPVGTLTIAQEQDVVNLIVFFGAAGLVGALASRRRREQLRAQALAEQLGQANRELLRLNREQAEAAQAALRLVQSEQQLRALQQRDRARRELLANVSHDLRTPIGTILTVSTNILARTELPTELRARTEVIAAQARRLGALVGDILDLARIESAALELEREPIPLGQVIAAAVDRLRAVSPERNVEWNREETGVEVWADWQRLGQIFDNLLANADRFAPPGTPVRIWVSGEGESSVSIRVVDYGPGVPPELRGHLFDRFVTGDTQPERSPASGTGLGLAIVRGLVQAHGGSVQLEPQTNGIGASFHFTLPTAERKAATPAERGRG